MELERDTSLASLHTICIRMHQTKYVYLCRARIETSNGDEESTLRNLKFIRSIPQMIGTPCPISSFVE